MPRPERPIGASDGPVQRLAADLRHLRAKGGSPPYRELAKTAHFSKATLSAAAAGHRLPTWEVTSAYVRACGGDVDAWRLRWQDARSELGLPPDTRQRTHVETEPGHNYGRPRTTARRRWGYATITAAGLTLVIVGAMWIGGRAGTAGRPAASPAAQPTAPLSRFQGSRELVADNNDPKKTRCAYDPAVTTLDSVEIDTLAENYLGIAELRYSPRCQVAWGRFTPSDRMTYLRDATVTIIADRPADHTKGVPYRVAFDGQAAFGNILSTQHACVQITVIIRAASGGGSATTKCER